jgi:hypothetical protein
MARIAFTTIVALGLLSSEAWAWARAFNGPVVYSQSWANAVAVDANGAIVAAGKLPDQFFVGLQRFAVLKLAASDGAVLWRREIAGTNESSNLNEAVAIAITAEGDVVAAGFTMFDLPIFTVVKINGATGELIWRRGIQGSGANNRAYAESVVVDGNGDVVAAGFSSIDGIGVLTTVKLAGATGEVMWRRGVTGTAADAYANSVTVDAVGDVIAAGTVAFCESTPPCTPQETHYYFHVLKMSGATGTLVWRQSIGGTRINGYDEALSVAIGAGGDVIAAGYTENPTTLDDITVVKLARDSGDVLWRTDINGTANQNDYASGVVVDAQGDAVVAGYTRNSPGSADFSVFKLSGGSGAEVWRALLRGAVGGFEYAQAVALNANGDVLAAGATHNFDASMSDFTVVKLRADTGIEVWHHLADGALGERSGANAVAIDANGDVAAAGITTNYFPSLTDFTVVKIRGTDGGDF